MPVMPNLRNRAGSRRIESKFHGVEESSVPQEYRRIPACAAEFPNLPKIIQLMHAGHRGILPAMVSARAMMVSIGGFPREAGSRDESATNTLSGSRRW